MQFYRAKYRVRESQGTVRIWVVRGSISEAVELGENQGTATVSYAVGPNIVRQTGDNPRSIKNLPEEGLLISELYGTTDVEVPPADDEPFPHWIDPWNHPSPKLDLEPGSDYATPGQDFTPITGQLSFGDGQSLAYIDVPIIDDDLMEFNEDLFVYLYNPSPDARTAGAATRGKAVVGPMWVMIAQSGSMEMWRVSITARLQY